MEKERERSEKIGTGWQQINPKRMMIRKRK